MDRILIADDHPQTVNACRAALAQTGMEVHAAADMPAAASILQQGGLRLAVVDAALPGGSLPAFCRQARNAGAGILLLVPPRFAQSELETLQLAADAILFKPFSTDDLAARVAELLRREGPAREEAGGYGPGESSAVGGKVAEGEPGTPDLAGARIGGCVLERFLGQGANGSVWLARHAMLELQVAVKLLPSALLRWSPQDRQRFVRGARAAAQVQHPNVVQLLHAGEDQGWLFLVQRYVEGESLKRKIERTGRIPEAEARSIMRQIASGLAAVHRLGIVHRDVKPANIMLDAAGTAFLTDFGLARDAGVSEISSVSAIVGTPLYMSPEQCSGAPVDGRSDLYSLGAAIYHAVTGRAPIEGRTPAAVLKGHAQTMPAAPASLGMGISAAFSEVIMRLLAKDPAARYQSAEEAEQALGLLA